MSTLEVIPNEILFSIGKENDSLMCRVCPKACILKINETGYCGIRVNNGEGIVSKTYGKTTGISVDPIEKKPLYHFQPGTDTLSIGGTGCNLSCKFCQNYSTSQRRDDASIGTLEAFSPQEIITIASRKKVPSISITYNEPTINIEYVIDIAKLAHDNNLKVIAVTNGFLQEKSAEFLTEYIDAANIDFKGDKQFYREICDARQTPVKKTVETWVDSGMHVEMTTLVIPGYNDSNEFISDTCTWIVNRLGENLPLHFSRFFPMYKFLSAPTTPLSTLLNCKEIAINKGLKYIYIGNVGFEVDDNTYCLNCNEILVERGLAFGLGRKGYATSLENYNSEKNCCSNCGTKTPIIT
jgi:pyruvate formate lyase activating enzyme